MKIRLAIALFLSLLLFSMSSFAAACDLSCSLQSFHSVCDASAVTSSEDQAMDMDMPAGMPMNHAQMASADPEAQTLGQNTLGDALIHATSCAHQSCGQAPSSLPSAKSRVERADVNSGQIVAIQTIRPIALPVAWMSVNSLPPGFTTIDPLSVSLRL